MYFCLVVGKQIGDTLSEVNIKRSRFISCLMQSLKPTLCWNIYEVKGVKFFKELNGNTTQSFEGKAV